MRPTLRSVLPLIGAVVTACGGVAPASPGPSSLSVPTAGTATMPPPTVAATSSPTIESAAEAYLAFVTDWNTRLAAVDAQFDAAGSDPVALGAAWAADAALDEAFIAGLDAIEFPESVAPAVSSLRAATDAKVRVARLLAESPTDQALQEQSRALAPPARTAGAELRRVLGLPPVAAATPTP